MKKNIATEIEKLVLPITDANGLELVDVEYVKEGGEFFLRVYIDKEGGVSLNECELVTRALNPILDEKDPIKDNYYLEVSSPGLNRKLYKDEHFNKFLGSNVKIVFTKVIDGNKNIQGILKDNTTIVIGSDNECEQAQECSVVTATYKVDKDLIGRISFIGPTRMDYSRIYSIINYMNILLNNKSNKF